MCLLYLMTSVSRGTFCHSFRPTVQVLDPALMVTDIHKSKSSKATNTITNTATALKVQSVREKGIQLQNCYGMKNKKVTLPYK